MNKLKNGFIIISLLFFLISCSDIVPLQKSDLKKYPWLTPFTLDLRDAEFKGYHNIDLGILEFNYEISTINVNEIFIKFDSIAEFDKWKIVKKSELTREYTRSISQNEKYTNQVLIKIEMDTIEQKLFFEIE
jgi:hypothetical protein